jgi:4-hydroxybenzoate polyprenyltransferase
MAKLRTLLVLGRVSNLPTVWSNCAAGWLLSGGGFWADLALMAFAASNLYLGGMFLNDAFDAQFDQQHRPERPIPTGAIPVSEVWGWGFGWLTAGVACLFFFSAKTITVALLLAATILLYDAVHKLLALAPLLMAFCRFLLILLTASAAEHGITGISLWSGLALASYIVGLSYLARKESGSATVRYWPCALLGVPLFLAYIVNRGASSHGSALLLGVMLAFWILRCLRFTLWSKQRNIGRTVSGLLAAIPLVDLLSVWEGSVEVAFIFVGLFVFSLALQRFVPAT